MNLYRSNFVVLQRTARKFVILLPFVPNRIACEWQLLYYRQYTLSLRRSYFFFRQMSLLFYVLSRGFLEGLLSIFRFNGDIDIIFRWEETN